MRFVLGIMMLASSCWTQPTTAPPVAKPVQPPEMREAAPEIDALPAGPFHTSARFCKRWEAEQNRDVPAQEKRCADDPNAEGCIGGCGLSSGCTLQTLPDGLRGPFASAELVEVDGPCGGGDCLLALGTPRGVWLVARVPQCSHGEGFIGNLQTVSLAPDGDALVWKYHHEWGEPGAMEQEDGMVRCRATVRAPTCEAE